jgi:hypothetical protein
MTEGLSAFARHKARPPPVGEASQAPGSSCFLGCQQPVPELGRGSLGCQQSVPELGRGRLRCHPCIPGLPWFCTHSASSYRGGRGQHGSSFTDGETEA